jgi:hypothetical protein
VLASGKSLSLKGVLFKTEVIVPIVGLMLLALLPIVLRKLKVIQ